MFCASLRNDESGTSATSLRSADPALRAPVWEGPALWAALTCRLSFPEGSITRAMIFAVWAVISGFSGKLLIEHKVKTGNALFEEAFREVLRETLTRNPQSPERARPGPPETEPVRPAAAAFIIALKCQRRAVSGRLRKEKNRLTPGRFPAIILKSETIPLASGNLALKCGAPPHFRAFPPLTFYSSARLKQSDFTCQ